MDVRDLKQARRFSAEKLVKNGVFATERMYVDVYCLEAGQAQKVHSHEGSDKVYLVLDGRATVTVGEEVREIAADEAALCPAGVPHGVANRSSARVTLLVVTSPPPTV